ncbi:hypothetical protein C8Q79DRAFT_919781, partial [Trametes meyenii]
CRLQDGEHVWIRLTESSDWIPGVVSGKAVRTSATREGQGTLYAVRYNRTKREYFAPQNGELKPDIPEIRELLVAGGGWIQD